MREYIMGVDEYDKGYKAPSFAICVIKNNDNNEKEVVAVYHSHIEKDYEAEIKRLADFYKIPDNKIFK